MVDVGDRDGAALGGDAAREAAAEGDAHALFDFFLDALGGAGVQRVAFEQEDRDGVDVQDVGDPLQQLLQQLLLGQVGQRRVGHPLQRLQPVRGTLGSEPGEALAAVEACLFDGEGGAVAGELEEVAFVVGEVAWGEAADVQDAEDAAFDDQGDAEQGLDALLAQDRVEDVGVVDVGDRDGAALGGDAAREAAAEGDAHALFDFFLDALGGAGVQRVALEQEDRDGVDVQDVGDPLQQLLQQLFLGEVGQRRVGHPLQRLQRPPTGQLDAAASRLRHSPMLTGDRGLLVSLSARRGR